MNTKFYLRGGLFLYVCFLLNIALLNATEKEVLNIQPLPDITITCDFWFPINPNDPNSNANDFDNIFGKMRVGTTSGRDSINIMDRVCRAHPRFNEFAPPSQFDDPCYDDLYRMYWGKDGYALGYGNLPLEQVIDLNLVCGQGEIIRKWRQYGGSQFITQQRIRIINCKEFFVPTQCWRFTPRDVGTCDLVAGNYAIKLIEWPCDVEISDCNSQQGGNIFDPDNLDVLFNEDRKPRFDDDNCSLMAASYNDVIFQAVDSVCVKVFRNWKVIDWCLYEQSIAGTYFGEYEWTHTQVIKLANNNTPDIEACQDTTYCGFGPGCEGEIEIRPGISDDCTPTSDLRIDYKIDLDNDGDYDLLGYSDNQGATYPFPNPNNLPVRTFEADSANADGVYPVGTHKILWAAEDGCGNVNVCANEFTVEDCKPPTPYCEIGISTVPMDSISGGSVEIWASDFDLGSTDNCTTSGDLVFSFSDDINDRSRSVTCASSGSQIDYTVYVWDEAGNYSTCLVGVVLSGCPGSNFSSMVVEDEMGRSVADLQVVVKGPDGDEIILDLASGQLSDAEIAKVTFAGPYEVRPYKNTDFYNGVTTFDMVLIIKHILGVQSLQTPYKIIAADVNTGGTLTTLDLVDIRRLILFMTTTFPNDTESWGFIDADYAFPNPLNPFGSAMPQEFITTADLKLLSGKFIAYKRGDVNNSASGFQSNSSEDRSTSELLFELEDLNLVAGETYTIPLNLNADEHLLGMQFSLLLDQNRVEVISASTGAYPQLDDNNLNLQQSDKGLIHGTWAPNASVAMNEGSLLNIEIRAKENTRLSEVLALSSDYLNGEAYSENGDQVVIHDLGIQFNNQVLNTANQTYQYFGNQPNPFSDQTTISFHQGVKGMVNLEVYDALGRQIYTASEHREAGLQTLTLDQSLFTTTGLHYFKLRVNDWQISGNLLYLEQ